MDHEAVYERHVCFEHRGAVFFQSSFARRAYDFCIMAFDGKNGCRTMDLRCFDSFGGHHGVYFDDPIYFDRDGGTGTIGT